jgi:hypothetical protein
MRGAEYAHIFMRIFDQILMRFFGLFSDNIPTKKRRVQQGEMKSCWTLPGMGGQLEIIRFSTTLTKDCSEVSYKNLRANLTSSINARLL